MSNVAAGPNQGDLLELIGVGDESAEEQAELLTNMLTLIQNRAFDRILGTLSEDVLARLNGEVAESEDPNAMDAFLAEYVPDYPRIYEEEAQKLRQQLILKFSKAENE